MSSDRVDDFVEYWIELGRSRVRSIPGRYPDLSSPRNINPLLRWVRAVDDLHGSSSKVIPGSDRDKILQIISEDIQREKSRILICRSLPEVLAKGSILEDLLSSPELVVEESLQALLTHQKDNPYFDAYQLVLEARFELKESAKAKAQKSEYIQAIREWLSGSLPDMISNLPKGFRGAALETEEDRLCALLFILSLAKQNDVLDGVLLYTDSVEALVDTKGLRKNLLHLDDWVRRGSSVRAILGWRGSEEDIKAMKKSNPRLLKRLQEDLLWIKY